MIYEEPLVSIITPCYNGEKFIDRYFESILNQTYKRIELIFINDGSTDNTETIALSYRKMLEQKGIKYIYIYQENEGQASALNNGLKMFTGDYLTWPDSDDVMRDDCIEKKVAFLQDHPEYGFCICKSMTFYPDVECSEEPMIIQRIPGETDNFFEDMLKIRNVFVPGAYMVRAEAFLNTIKDRNIFSGRGGQNAQILLPISYYYKCGYIDEVLNYYCIRQQSHSHSKNSPEKKLDQLIKYETIVDETLKKMGVDVFSEYSLKARRFYAHMRFGNAIDTEKKELIKREYKNLKELKCITVRELLLYLKKMAEL